MTIWIYGELPLFNFERLNMWWAWIGHPSEKLLAFEFFQHIVVLFRASRYVMRLNWTSVWKVMTIWIFREFPLFNFEHLYTVSAWIGPPCEKLWPFEFLESFCYKISSVSIYYAPESDIRVKCYDHLNFARALVVIFRASLYIMHVNLSSVWKFMTIWISRELPLFNFERLDMWCTWIGHPTEKLWPFEFINCCRCSILSVAICDAPESDIRVKSYDHLNFFIASVVQFWASRNVMLLNQTSELKVMTIWISS